ncbi:MAG: hypothetical protein Tsb0021_12820 [Chlamydiales bacterium]
MFGLENKKKGKGDDEFTFEIEKEMLDPDKGKQMLELVEKRIGQIKSLLRGGEEKESFQKLGTLLYGYASITKVISRTRTKKK